MFGNRERRRKERRIKYFFFLCLDCFDCNEEENKKKIYVFFFLLLYPYKCKRRQMKIMNKCVTLYHIILCTWVLLFKNHSPPSITPNLSRLQICEFKRNGFFLFYYFYGIHTKERTTHLLIYLLFLFPPAFQNEM